HDVREEDHERVRDERDLDRGPGDARERHEDLEEREARDRVEERRDDADRVLRAAEPVGEQREREREREADPDGDRRQLDVLHERRPERVAPVPPHPVPAERVVAADACASLAEGRDDRAAARQRSAPASESRKTPSTRSPSATVTRSSPVSSMSETAFRTVVDGGTVGPAGAPAAGARSTSASVRSASRRSARSSPMNAATNASAGCARIASGVS